MNIGIYDWSFKTLEWCIENNKEYFCYRELPKNLKTWNFFLEAGYNQKIINTGTKFIDGKHRPTWSFTMELVNKYHEQFIKPPEKKYFKNRTK